jgi:hypothetical protein
MDAPQIRKMVLEQQNYPTNTTPLLAKALKPLPLNSFSPSAKIGQSFGMFLKKNFHHMSIVHWHSHALRTLLLAMPFSSNIGEIFL